MRKWMRERLQRRKKTPEQPSQPAPPPLQPAYFDVAQPPVAESAASRPETENAAIEAEPAVPTAPEEEASGAKQAQETGTDQASALAAPAQRGRSRRRRGGRGRGGRGREKAVAQAFAPKLQGSPPASQETVESQEEPSPITVEGEAAALTPEPPPVPIAIPVATERAPKGLVVLAIGLPGSGKSSWFKRHNVTPLSSDMMRTLLFDDVREQRFQDLVFSNLRSMLKARIIAKRPMNYVDATNLTPQERQHWIKLAKDYGYEVHAVFFDVPLEVCIERHNRRDRVVPEEVMRRMAAKLKPPSFSEGFAKITVVRVKKKE